MNGYEMNEAPEYGEEMEQMEQMETAGAEAGREAPETAIGEQARSVSFGSAFGRTNPEGMTQREYMRTRNGHREMLERQRFGLDPRTGEYASKNAEPQEQDEAQEQTEEGEGREAMGYSSDYYEHEMARALKNVNRIAYDNAKRNWANAKAKEETSKIR